MMQGGVAPQSVSLENELVGELSDPRSSAHRPDVLEQKHEQKSAVVPANGGSPKPEPNETRKRLNPIKRKQLQERLAEVEEEINRIEAAIAFCETQLQTFVSAEELQRQTHELGLRKSDLQQLMSEWEDLSAALESPG